MFHFDRVNFWGGESLMILICTTNALYNQRAPFGDNSIGKLATTTVDSIRDSSTIDSIFSYFQTLKFDC